MTTLRLTHQGIAKLEAGRWMTDFWDDRLPGFAVRAHPSGTKTYIYRYRKYETKGRDRFLSPSEIRRVWNTLDDENLLQRSVVRMALLTAQRIGEVLSMRWEDLDLEERVWTIPKEVAKSKLAHRVPLTPQALAIIEEMREAATGSICVFPSRSIGGDPAGEGFRRYACRHRDSPIEASPSSKQGAG